MKLLIDDANTEKIKEILASYPIDGVTTNPSILSKSARNPYEVLEDIRSIIGPEKELHVQVISTTAEGMREEARIITQRLGENTYIKIPSVPEGFKAMMHLSKQGYNLTATAIYTPMQAFLAAKSGADYAAPYVNRIDNLGANGVDTAKKIHDIFVNNALKTEVLAASFKNSQQVLALCEYGIGAATIAPEVIENFVKNAAVDAAVDAFTADFQALCGRGISMANC